MAMIKRSCFAAGRLSCSHILFLPKCVEASQVSRLLKTSTEHTVCLVTRVLARVFRQASVIHYLIYLMVTIAISQLCKVSTSEHSTAHSVENVKFSGCNPFTK